MEDDILTRQFLTKKEMILMPCLLVPQLDCINLHNRKHLRWICVINIFLQSRFLLMIVVWRVKHLQAKICLVITLFMQAAKTTPKALNTSYKLCISVHFLYPYQFLVLIGLIQELLRKSKRSRITHNMEKI